MYVGSGEPLILRMNLAFGVRTIRFELYQARTFGSDIMVAYVNVDLIETKVLKLDFWKTLKSEVMGLE
jgi:hypothetical protein